MESLDGSIILVLTKQGDLQVLRRVPLNNWEFAYYETGNKVNMTYQKDSVLINDTTFNFKGEDSNGEFEFTGAVGILN